MNMDTRKENMAFLEKMSAYRLVMREDLSDIHAEGVLLEHVKSGARVLLIPCNDDNKVFSIGFRTPPTDSTGVAHIIEHSVLCGSEEFPLKDPFVELVKGSLNTFLNAMTYPDKTVYPVASTNDADFRNLMHVYLDAVFRPEIYRNEKIFRQEGWRYEMENADSPLTINGVVYNEMKGVFSSPDSVLERETMNALFPDTAYGVESGGDPDAIPGLTYEAFLDFHRRYYHPSNSYIYLYGDLDYADTLSFLDKSYLSGYDRIELDSTLKHQDAFSSRKRIRKEYPVAEPEEEENNMLLSWNVVVGDPFNVEDILTCQALDYALFSAPGAPVKQALIDAGLGLDVYGEYTDGILQPYFSVIARELGEKDAPRFEEVLLGAMRKQAEEGINRKALNAALNSMEFHFREADFGAYPKGLMYGLDMLDTWLYDDLRPFDAVRKLQAFETLRAKMEEGYFEKFLEERFLNNTHGAMLLLVPKAGLMQEKEEKKAEGLARLKASLTEEAAEQIIKETHALREWQSSPDTEEEMRKLPLLARSDIRPGIREFSNMEERIPVGKNGPDGGVPTVFHRADSNGIFHLDLFFDMGHIEPSRLPLAGLLRTVLFGMDTGRYRYQELSNEIYAETGGIAPRILAVDRAGEPHRYRPFFCIQGKALRSRAVHMMELMKEVMTGTVFTDRKRLFELVSQTRIQMQTSLQEAGNAAAALRAGAYYSESLAFQEKAGGISYFRYLKDLEEHFEEKAEGVMKQLAELSRDIFRGDRMTVSCTGLEEDFGILRKSLSACVPEGNRSTAGTFTAETLGRRNEAFRTAGQVQFVAMGGWYADHGFRYRGAMLLLRQILSYDYLWQQVRVQGGAYGCSGSLRMTGDGMFASYRDPNLARTKEVYEGIPEYLRQFTADERTMTKYIIGTMNAVDQPLTPSMFGRASMSAWLAGLTDEDRQKSRDDILSATQETVRSLADAAAAVLEEGYLCVIGSEQAVNAAGELFLHVENLI